MSSSAGCENDQGPMTARVTLGNRGNLDSSAAQSINQQCLTTTNKFATGGKLDGNWQTCHCTLCQLALERPGTEHALPNNWHTVPSRFWLAPCAFTVCQGKRTMPMGLGWRAVKRAFDERGHQGPVICHSRMTNDQGLFRHKVQAVNVNTILPGSEHI